MKYYSGRLTGQNWWDTDKRIGKLCFWRPLKTNTENDKRHCKSKGTRKAKNDWNRWNREKRQRKLRKPKVGPLKKILKRQTLAKPIKESWGCKLNYGIKIWKNYRQNKLF